MLTWRSASSYKISLKSDNQSTMSYGQKNDFQDGGHRHLEFFKISIFGHVTVIGFNICCNVPNFIEIGRFFTAVVYQISSKSDDFSLRYGDLTISKWRPSAILDFKICSFVTWHLSACRSAS